MLLLRLAIASALMRRRSWLIPLWLTATLTVPSQAGAQSATGSTAAASAMSPARDHAIAALNPGEPDVIPGDLSTRTRVPLLKGNHPPVDRLAGNVRTDTLGRQSLGARDSLRNGAIIGTVIGAAAFGAFAAALCNAYQAEGDPSCLPDTLRFGAIGGALGAGAGLAIDAARNQRGVTLRFAITF